ncbi:MAG: ABC transporter substrate-binding protein [Alphaproteobacteria bacterium]
MSGDREHPYLPTLEAELVRKRIDRREFLRTATLLGMSATAAYAFADRVTGEGAGEARAQAAPAANKPKGGTLRIGMRCMEVGSPHTYSWVEASNSGRAVLDYLTVTGPDNVTRGSLVERWEASPDLKTWTLHLRRDVKWRKGRAFTADDVVWNLKRVLDPKTGSSTIGLMKGFILDEFETDEVDAKGAKKKSTRLWSDKAIEKVDDHTVRLNGKSAQLAIPEQLYHYPLLIMDPAEGGKFEVGSNGTGPFEMVENVVGRKQVFRARKDYWGEGPYVDQLECIDLGTDQAAQLSAIASGQVDMLYGTDIQIAVAIEKLPNMVMHKVDTSYTAVARMQPVKPLDDKRVRKAIQHATDVNAILAAAHRGLGLPGEHHHVSPIHPEYAKLPPVARDIPKAKTLLAEAGYPNGVDVEFTCRQTPAWEPAAAQIMVEQWKDAGIRAKITVMPDTQYWEVWTKVPFGLTTWAHRPLGVLNLALAYRSGGAWNESKYSNPEFDRLLTEAEGTLDVEKRRAIMAKLEQILLDDAPIIVPLWRALFTFSHKKVVGFRMHPSAYINANEIAVTPA